MIRRELRSCGQDLLVNCSSQMQLISRLLFTQYGIYIKLFLLFWLSRVLGMSTFSRRDECGGVTCACTCPKRRNINVVIQDTCTLSSSVNKCITICTPSIHLVVRLATPFTLFKAKERRGYLQRIGSYKYSSSAAPHRLC